jgi:hypothetical protein
MELAVAAVVSLVPIALAVWVIRLLWTSLEGLRSINKAVRATAERLERVEESQIRLERLLAQTHETTDPRT